MGVVLDSSVLMHAERRELNVDQMLTWLSSKKIEEVAMSTISLMEFAHGIERLKSDRAQSVSESFMADLILAIPVLPVSAAIAIRAGRLDGSLRKAGITIGMADGLIAATALDAGFGVATLNGRHFKMVPGLDVVEL